MSFRGMVASDRARVFFNDSEFAERRTVTYDDVEYTDIPVVLQTQGTELRSRDSDDYVTELNKATAVCFLSRDNVSDANFKQGHELLLSPPEGKTLPELYTIADCREQMGFIELQLEAIGE